MFKTEQLSKLSIEKKVQVKLCTSIHGKWYSQIFTYNLETLKSEEVDYHHEFYDYFESAIDEAIDFLENDFKDK